MKTLLISAALVCAGTLGSAAVVDFEVPVTDFDVNQVANGFDFVFSARGWYIGDPNDTFYPDGVTNGTDILVASGDNVSPASVTMSLVGGGTFDIFSLLAASSNLFIDNTIEVLGNLSGGGTVSATLSTTGAFASYVLVGFEDLTSVVFSSGLSGPYNAAGFALDNIQISAVPVPASLPLLMAGLFGLAAIRRRRSA
jgi:hypothetical protein